MDTQNDQPHISQALQHALNTLRTSKQKERAITFDRLRQLFGDKFHSEGVSEYRRTLELQDEMFDDVIEKYVDREWIEREENDQPN